MLAGGLLFAAACQQGDSHEYATPTPGSISTPATETREAATAFPTAWSPTASDSGATATITPTSTPSPMPTPDLQGFSTPEPELKETPPALETPVPYDGGSVSTAEAGVSVDVVALAQQVFGANWLAAVRVAWCESSFGPGATGAEGEMGIWQIHPRWHSDATYDPLGNALAAYRISAGGVNWSAWTHGPERAAGADCSSSKPAWDRMTARSPPAYDGSDTSGSVPPTPTRTATPVPSGPACYTPGKDSCNCSDFATWGAAQAFHNTYDPNDINRLDADGDGDVCESLPGYPG